MSEKAPSTLLRQQVLSVLSALVEKERSEAVLFQMGFQTDVLAQKNVGRHDPHQTVRRKGFLEKV